MTEIEKKALALLNEVRKERRLGCFFSVSRETTPDDEALCRAIEQHETFKQEVSDAVEAYVRGDVVWPTLEDFIIPKPKPDPLVEVLDEITWTNGTPECVAKLRAALEARGLEIREKSK